MPLNHFNPSVISENVIAFLSLCSLSAQRQEKDTRTLVLSSQKLGSLQKAEIQPATQSSCQLVRGFGATAAKAASYPTLLSL